MHSAFLLTETGWQLTDQPKAVLDHLGDLLVNEDKEDVETNLELLGAREGRAATLTHHKVVFADSVVHRQEDPAVQELSATGEARLWHLSYFAPVKLPNKGGEFSTYYESYWYDEERHKRDLERWRGVVAVKEGDWFRLFRDEDLWERCEAKRKKDKRKAYLASLRRPPRKDQFLSVAAKCAESLGLPYPKGFRVAELLVWVRCHDAVKGRRATNKLLRVVAKQWCGDREESKKWLGRWSSGDVVEETDKRLATVLRLGNKNSWLKK